MASVRGPVVTALDVGTTKICILQARMEETRGPKRLRPVALGRVQAEGISEAKVTNLDKLAGSIDAALQSLQRQASPRLPKKVYVGVAGNYCISKNASVTVEIKSPQRGIRPADLERVFNKVRESYGTAEHGYRLLHIIVKYYKINNDLTVYEPPLGLQAESLTAFVHLVYAHVITLANLYRAIELVGLEVEEMVLESYASSLAVLNDDERQNGVILLDIGGGTTDIAVFHKGSMVYSGVVPLAGDKVTGDLAQVLHIPIKNAELLKREFAAGVDGSYAAIYVPDATQGEEKPVDWEKVRGVIIARLEQILSEARDLLERERVFSQWCLRGLVLTGGTALLHGIEDVARQIFEPGFQRYLGYSALSVAVKTPASGPLRLEGEHSALSPKVKAISSPHPVSYHDPALSTVCGLAWYALNGPSIAADITGSGTWWGKVRSLWRALTG